MGILEAERTLGRTWIRQKSFENGTPEAVLTRQLCNEVTDELGAALSGLSSVGHSVVTPKGSQEARCAA